MVIHERALAQQMKRLKIDTHSVKMLHRLLPLEWSGHLKSLRLGMVRGGPLPEQCLVMAKRLLPIVALFLQLFFSFKFFSICCSLVLRIDHKKLFLLLLVLIFYCRLLYGVL